MADTTTFFQMWVGDDNTLQFTVVDDAGAVLDISSATEITWKMSVDENTASSISKSMTGGTIALVGGGTTGVFNVTLLAADTASLVAGTYYQESTLTLSSQLTHVTVGTVWLRPSLP